MTHENIPDGAASPSTVSRRTLLAGAAGAAALGAAEWTPVLRISAANAQTAAPPNFPPGISLYQQAYRNWSGEISIDNVWTCAPADPAAVVAVVNWAHANGYRVRPRGMSHTWAPILLPEGSDVARVVLVDTTRNLTSVSIAAGGSPAKVTAQTGVTMDSLLVQLQAAGLGFTAIPAPGDLTLGGVLAIGAHGSGIPAVGETRPGGTSYGTLSNLILSLTAVVWDGGSYTLKTFQRTDPDIAAFLVHLGRAFVTEVTLQVGADYRLRCQSWYNVPAATVFGPSGTSGNTLTSCLDSSGRVEAIWWPYTDNPWLKVWTRAANRPALSNPRNGPYAYTFANQVSDEANALISDLQRGITAGTPLYCQLELALVQTALVATGTWDIWGWSKDMLLYVKPTTLRIVEAGFAVVTARANIQRVLNDFYVQYKNTIAAYQSRGRFPMNGPVEIRVSGLDRPGEVAVAGAVAAQLSPARPRPDHPEWDVCVWLDLGTIPGTPHANEFYRDPEWSKAWAVTNAAAWADTAVLTGTIPDSLRAGYPAGDNFDKARATLNRYDPNRIFSNPFLDILLP